MMSFSRIILFQSGEWKTQKDGMMGLKWIERRKSANEWASNVAFEKYITLQKSISKYVLELYSK